MSTCSPCADFKFSDVSVSGGGWTPPKMLDSCFDPENEEILSLIYSEVVGEQKEGALGFESFLFGFCRHTFGSTLL